MLSKDALLRIQTIVTHENCMDGLASAMLLKDALPQATVVFVQHKTDAYLTLPATDNMLFCDISPPRERVQEFLAKDNVIVLDHHKTAKDLVALFGTNGVFADEDEQPGVSGGYLAFREVWDLLKGKESPIQKLYVEEFAHLVGVRDTWQKSSPYWKQAQEQHKVMAFFPIESWMTPGIFDMTPESRNEWLRRFLLGPLLTQKEDIATKKLADQALYFTAGGLRFAVFQGLYTSDAADIMTEADIVIGWGYKVEDQAGCKEWPASSATSAPKLIFSCRAKGDANVSDFAGKHGGGGHTRAAGCSFEVKSSDLNPYVLIQKLVREHYGQ